MHCFIDFKNFLNSLSQKMSSSFFLLFNSKHVLTEDVLSRYMEDNKLICRRLLTKTNKVPKWGEVLVGRDSQVLIIEESVVDPVQKTLTTYTRNIGLQRIMVSGGF